MKRSRSTGERTAVRSHSPTPLDHLEQGTSQAPEETAAASLDAPAASAGEPMDFPGPFAYAPRPTAMQDELEQGTVAMTHPVMEPDLNESKTASASTVACVDGTAIAQVPALATTTGNPHGHSPLILAAATGNMPGLKALLRNPTVDINQRHIKTSHTALMAAARGGHLEALALLIAAGADVNLASDATRSSALMMVAMKGDVEALKMLLEHQDIELNQMDAIGYSALHWAVAENKLAAVACLLAAGADVNLANDELRHSALILAAMYGHVDILQALLAHNGIALDQTDRFGRSAVRRAADENQLEALALLLAAGADVDVEADGQRLSTLIIATFQRHVDMTGALPEHHGDALNQLGPDGYSALHCAVAKNKPEAVACLLAGGADVNLVTDRERLSALMIATLHGHIDILKALLKQDGIALNQIDQYGLSALHWSVDQNQPEAVACLLAAGAPVNLAVPASLSTPLIFASANGHVEVVRALLTCRYIALDQTDALGASALHFAVENNRPEVVACLLARGASMTLANAEKHTALSLAVGHKHVAVIEVLMSYGVVLPFVPPIENPQDDFHVTLADLDADQKYPADPESNPLGLKAPAGLDEPFFFISELVGVLVSNQDLLPWLGGKGIRMACALPVAECLSAIYGIWPALSIKGQPVSKEQRFLVTAAALGRLPVLTGDGTVLARYKAAGASVAGAERLSAVARGQIEELIALSGQMLARAGSAMLASMVKTCLENTNPAHQVKTSALSAELVREGWLLPLAEAIAASWQLALALLAPETVPIPEGSSMKQIVQLLGERIERLTPRLFSQELQRKLADHALLAALHNLIGSINEPEILHMLFQNQCDQLRQYCEQVGNAG